MEPPPPAWVGPSRLLRVILWITGAGMILLLVLWSRARDRDGDALLVQLVLGGLAAWCLWMALSWRWLPILGARFVDPGQNLGMLSKTLGALAICALPVALRLGSWPAAAAAVGLGAAALALWLGWSWAVWPWFLVAVGSFVLAGYLLWIALERWNAAPPGTQDVPRLPIGMVLLLAALGTVLIKELVQLQARRGRGSGMESGG